MRTASSSAITATALAAVAALTLSACGGSSGDDGKIHASGKHTPKSKPSAKPSASASAGTPKITFGPDEKTVYESWKTGDPSKDTILQASSNEMDSIYAAISAQQTATPAMKYYLKGTAYTGANTFVVGWLKTHDTWVGEIHYFNRRFTMMPDGTASVIYCSDESKANIKHLKTGKVENEPTSSKSYVLYNTRLTKNKKGVWQTTDVLSKRGASQCQR